MSRSGIGWPGVCIRRTLSAGTLCTAPYAINLTVYDFAPSSPTSIFWMMDGYHSIGAPLVPAPAPAPAPAAVPLVLLGLAYNASTRCPTSSSPAHHRSDATGSSQLQPPSRTHDARRTSGHGRDAVLHGQPAASSKVCDCLGEASGAATQLCLPLLDLRRCTHTRGTIPSQHVDGVTSRPFQHPARPRAVTQQPAVL
jgi:hypothetical protein